jgi:hypothetical protein
VPAPESSEAAATRPRSGGQAENLAGWRDLAATLDEQFHRLGRGRPLLRVDRAIAGRQLAFGAWSPEPLARAVRPIASLPAAEAGSPRLEIRVGHGDLAGLDLFASSPRAEADPPATRPRLLLGDGRDVLGAVWPASGMLGLLDVGAATAHLWLREPRRVTTADAATLVRALVTWWLGDGDFGVVHAAAVAGARGAALLSGRGGTGKSSTAAAGFAAGLSFLGDDSVLCRASSAEVHSINSCVTLFRDDLALLPGRRAPRGAGSRARDGKVAVDLAQLQPERVLPRAPLCALVALTRAERGASEVRPAARSLVLASLVPTSLFNVPAPQERTLAAVAALVRRLPAYELVLSGDPVAAGAALRRFLDGAAPGFETAG